MHNYQQMYEAGLLEITALKRELHKLENENRDLRDRLMKLTVKPELEISEQVEPTERVNPATTLVEEGSSTIHQYSKVEEKLAVYRSYFRGREDVYPIRWSNKQGKSGYSPACGNEWTAVCQKPKIKCSACAHQSFLPVSDEALSKEFRFKLDSTVHYRRFRIRRQEPL